MDHTIEEVPMEIMNSEQHSRAMRYELNTGIGQNADLDDD